MPYTDLAALPSRSIMGCKARVMHSQHMTFVHWDFEPGQTIPEHAHPHEQVATIIEGELEISVAGETRRVGPGSVVVIPPQARHWARALSRCYAIDAFYPIREDYR